jgi:hypothetical protein
MLSGLHIHETRTSRKDATSKLDEIEKQNMSLEPRLKRFEDHIVRLKAKGLVWRIELFW